MGGKMCSKLECSVCGSNDFRGHPVLWPKLVDEWQLSPSEAAYVDRQQGESCTVCGANLRSVALSNALRYAVGTTRTLDQFTLSPEAKTIQVLELNKAGTLNTFLARMPGHVFAAYPDVDIHSLPWQDNTFDIVTHSDTLEHVSNPVHALAECRRVLKSDGMLCLTIPIIVGRMTRGREGLPKSYHGSSEEGGDDYVVHTEFGADAWAFLFEAGFSRATIFPVAYPSALAMAARK